MTFPFVLPAAPEFPGPPSAEADLVVIGGGVVGVSAALFAARAGHRVVLLEKGRIAAEQSSRNWGWVRVQGRDMAEIPVVLEAQAHWQSFEAECKGRLGLRQVGTSYLARTEAALERYEGWLKGASAYGLSSRMLSRRETRHLMNEAAVKAEGALHTPTDWVAEPWTAVPELARLAQQAGVQLVERCAVRALDVEAGRITGVMTEAGRVAASRVILAGGAWSSLFLRRHGVALPQLAVRSTALATGPVPQVFSGAAGIKRLAMRRRADGGYTLAPGGNSEFYIGPDALRALPKYLTLLRQGGLGVDMRFPAPKGFPDALGTPRRWEADAMSPFERMRVLNPTPAKEKVPELLRRFRQLWPEIGPVPVKAVWAGMIDVLPDVVPVVDKVPGLNGLVAVTGMSGHGFGSGPAFGRIGAALAMDAAHGHDLSRFRFARFSDGSRLRPGPAL